MQWGSNPGGGEIFRNCPDRRRRRRRRTTTSCPVLNNINIETPGSSVMFNFWQNAWHHIIDDSNVLGVLTCGK